MRLAKTSPLSPVLLFFMNQIVCSGLPFAAAAAFSSADLIVRSSSFGLFGFSSSLTCGGKGESGL